MEEDIILNTSGELPQVADTTIPLTPDVPIDVTTPIEPESEVVCCDTIGSFFGTIQESVTISWRYHLKTHKHYIHLATQEYYYSALNLVDKIIESYQGDSGIIIENYTNCICDEGKTENEYFKELQNFVSVEKTKTPWKEEIISLIDDLINLINSTLYKLNSFNEHVIKTFDEFCFEDYDVIGVEGGVEGTFDNVTKTTNTQQGAGYNLGVEGGVEGTFDNVTKTTSDNVAPTGKKDKHKDCDDEKCDKHKKHHCDDHDEEEEEE